MSLDSSAAVVADTLPSLEGRRVRLVGRFASVSRRETAAAVQRRGGVIDDESPEWIVVGEETRAEEWNDARHTASALGVRCVSESELWRWLGLVDDSTGVRRLYSPAMLAELVDAPLVAVRRWARRGLLRASCRVNRLEYFDFEEARVAQLLAELLRQRGSLAQVDARVERLIAAHVGVDRPLAELPLSVADGELWFRVDEGIAESTGQLCFDFDTESAPEHAVLSIDERPSAEPRSLRDEAWELSEQGRLEEAIEAWRLAMFDSPPAAEDHFTLAEWLFQSGRLQAAVERYYAALELDVEHLEARVNLGCVLADLGDVELAIASLEGALQQHEDFADAHYHLGRLHQAAGHPEVAEPYWRRFLEVAPQSPWADEARAALARQTT